MPTVRPATIEDAHQLAPRLRKADLMEMQALIPTPPLQVLLESVREGTETYTIVAGDGSTVIGMFGIHHFEIQEDFEAAVWLLASDDLVTIKSELLRQTIPYLKKFHQKYPLLWNIVDARNEVHIRWLKRMGFSAYRKHERLGVAQLPFYEFARIDSTICATSPQPA